MKHAVLFLDRLNVVDGFWFTQVGGYHCRAHKGALRMLSPSFRAQ